MRFEHEIIWHLYPLGFTGAEAAGTEGLPVEHRLPQIEAWLDYVIELGGNAVQLGPVFESETHGYDTRDHYRIDPRLGDESDLRSFISAAHARGVRVVLDGVFNHVGRSFPRFVAAQAGESAAAAWFRPRGDDWEVFEGHSALVALNHAHPPVVDYVVDVMRHWLDVGIDGWRLDAAYAPPAAFWQQVQHRVRQTHPHAWLLAEVIHGDYSRFIAESGLDSVTQYRLWKAIWSSLNDVNLWELAAALDDHTAMLDTFLPTVFVGNHDTTRIASQLTDERHLEHALTLLFFSGGIPAVYAGDEQAFRGVKEDRAGGDDAVRPPFPADPAELSPIGEPWLRMHQRLTALRRARPWLVAPRIERVELSNERLVYRLHERNGTDQLTVVLNLSDSPASDPSASGEQVLHGSLDAHRAAIIGRPFH